MDMDQPTNEYVLDQIDSAIEDLMQARNELRELDPSAPTTPEMLEFVSDAGAYVAFDAP